MTVVGRKDLGNSPGHRTNAGRVQHREEIDGLIAAWAQQNTNADVMGILNANGILAGSINSPADILRDPHFLERQAIVNVLMPEVAGHAGVSSQDFRKLPEQSARQVRDSALITAKSIWVC
jgi:crotonobetainyl-CoA:carnitine CoA-transferase CaiB-like acyl-CoA transferase